MICARLWALDGKVTIVDTETGIKPVHFRLHEWFGDEAVGRDDLNDLLQVSLLASKVDLCHQHDCQYKRARDKQYSGEWPLTF